MRSSKSFSNLFQLEGALVQNPPSTAVGSNRSKRRYIQLVTNTGVRRLLISETRPATSSIGILDQSKLDQMKTEVIPYVNPESKFERALRVLQEKERLAHESEMRKQSLERCARRCKTAGSNRDKLHAAETFQRDNLLISRAQELQKEREDEMKLCNSLLLMSKCQTIRDAQVAEKTLIAKELKDVERKLDRMMEEDRTKALQAQDKLREKEEAKKRSQFESLTKQIELNRELKEVAISAIEKERCRIRKIEEQRTQELEEERKRKLVEQERRKVDIDKANQALKRMKEEQREKEVALNTKIQNILKEKIASEKAQEMEKKQIQMLRDKEFARLEKERKRSDEMVERQYEMKCRQVQEERDREWRRCELEEQKKRKAATEVLIQCRRKQEEHGRHYQAMELDRCRAMTEMMEKLRQSEIEKEMEKERNAKKKMLEYRRNLQRLMEEKQQQKRKLQDAKLVDGRKLREEQQNRIEGLKTSIERKIIEVRNQKVPEKYLKEVEKQLHKQLTKIRI